MLIEQNVLIDPCGVARPPRYWLAERREGPDERALGLLNNGKTNVRLILEKVGETVAEQLGFSKVVHFRKLGVAHPCPEKMLDDIKSQCTAVVNGIGDWGSCTSWSIHDGIELERRGIPTATLTTDEFPALAKRECGSLGLPEMPLVVLPHPTSSLLGPDAEARAKDAVSEVVRIITENARSLAEAYAAKEYAAPKRAFRAKQVFK